MANSVFLLLQFLSVLAFAMFWYRVFDWKAEQSICMALASAMALVFVFGYLGNARIALVILYLLSACGLILFAAGDRIVLFAGRTQRRRDFFTPGVALLVLVFVYGVIFFFGIRIRNWDELSQWGKSVTYMLNYNNLPFGENFDSSDTLLSTTTMFHYYFCKLPKLLSGEIVESNMYVSNLVLWFSAAMLPLGGRKWKEWKSCALYALVVFLAMNLLFVQPYYNIYCDQPLTMWVGGILAWMFFCRRDKYSGIFIVLALLDIGFMKSMMGPLFGCIILLAMVIQYVMNYESGVKETLRRIWADRSLRGAVYAVSCTVAVFLFTLLWSVYIGQNAVFKTDLPLGDQSDRFRLTVQSGLPKWFESVGSSSLFPMMTFFLALLLTAVLGYVLSRKISEEKLKKQYSVLIFSYCVGFVCFFVLMLYAYLTVFTYADSITTGSFDRYMSDFILIGLLPLIFPAFLGEPGHTGLGNRTCAVALLVFFALGTSNGFVDKSTSWQLFDSDSYQLLSDMDDYRDAALELMDSDERIYMINQDADGYGTVAADYVFGQLLDRPGMCYYFTEDDENIVGLSTADIRVLPEILLDGYGYLWIYRTDEYFDSLAFDILKIPQPENGDFYKVESEEGRLKLTYLGEIG